MVGFRPEYAELKHAKNSGAIPTMQVLRKAVEEADRAATAKAQQARLVQQRAHTRSQGPPPGSSQLDGGRDSNNSGRNAGGRGGAGGRGNGSRGSNGFSGRGGNSFGGRGNGGRGGGYPGANS